MNTLYYYYILIPYIIQVYRIQHQSYFPASHHIKQKTVEIYWPNGRTQIALRWSVFSILSACELCQYIFYTEFLINVNRYYCGWQSAGNTWAKRLKIYMDTYKPAYAIKFSAPNFAFRWHYWKNPASQMRTRIFLLVIFYRKHSF